MRHYGAAFFFRGQRVERWKAMMAPPFNSRPTDWFRKKVELRLRPGGKFSVRRPFSNHSNHTECRSWYNEGQMKFGTCGERMGGGEKMWQAAGCPDLSNERPICGGSFSKAKERTVCQGDLTKCGRATGRTVTQSARWTNRKSSIDGRMQRFYGISISGNTTSNIECSMDYFLRVGVCLKGKKKDHCCCKGGLIKVETQTADTSGKREACKSWFIQAMTGASNFFSIVRMQASVWLSDKCSARTIAKNCGNLKRTRLKRRRKKRTTKK